MPRLLPVCARRGGEGATWRFGRPGSSQNALAGAGGSTLGRLLAPAVVVLRAPWLGRSYEAVVTPHLQRGSVSRGRREGGGDMHTLAVGVFRTPGRRSHLALGHPGRSRSALAGMEESLRAARSSRLVVCASRGGRESGHESAAARARRWGGVRGRTPLATAAVGHSAGSPGVRLPLPAAQGWVR